ncbi:MAG TPA: hypothetical protein VF959_02980 [Casimicrobiaceae bacterium]
MNHEGHEEHEERLMTVPPNLSIRGTRLQFTRESNQSNPSCSSWFLLLT